MIINKDALLKYISSKSGPLSVYDIMRHFRIHKRDRHKFNRFMDEVLAEGKIIKIKDDKYGLTAQMNLVTGVLQGHPNGFGFVRPDEPDESGEDIHIGNSAMSSAMHGDRVVVRVNKSGALGDKKKDGEIIRVLERANKNIVGIYEENKHFGFVIPDDKRVWHHIYIARELSKGVRNGQKVMAKITEFPEKGRNPEGEITEVIGYKNDPFVDERSVLLQFGVPIEFPDKVLKEAEEIDKMIPEAEIEKREDFRLFNIFTIDGEDAKDFDDAVSIKRLPKGEYELGVHIADVSYYVKEETELDREAFKRGNSIYIPNKVIPMLPEALSNEMCSLKPRVDRLTMSVVMKINAQGNVKDYKIHKSVINSKRRLTYNIVSDIIEKKEMTQRDEYSDVVDELDTMYELAKKLHNKRRADGSVDFDLPESKVIINNKDIPLRVIKIERNWAHRLIEEFMLLTNEIVDTELFRKGYPSIHRIHETPDNIDILELARFVNLLGYNFKPEKDIQASTLQKLLEKCKGTPEEMVINKLSLRSMKLAVYSTEAKGHFALAKKFYAHFTSPIRRYPDLAVHRLTKNLIESKGRAKDQINVKRLARISAQCSGTERVAEDIEEEIVKIKKIQLLRNRMFETFDAVVSGVQNYGVFVEIKDLMLEGLVHVSSITDDYYAFDEKKYALVGKNKKRVIRLGDPVKIKVINADLDKRQVDLKLADSIKN